MGDAMNADKINVPTGTGCPLDKRYGDLVCRDGMLWGLTYSEMAPPDSRQCMGECENHVHRKTNT